MKLYIAQIVTVGRAPEVMLTAVSQVSSEDAVEKVKEGFKDSYGSDTSDELWQSIEDDVDSDYRLVESEAELEA